MDKQDVILEVSQWLKANVKRSELLIRFDELAATLSPFNPIEAKQITENFDAAAAKAEVEILERTETRAVVRRKAQSDEGITQRWMPDID
jgi:hypothetical protein